MVHNIEKPFSHSDETVAASMLENKVEKALRQRCKLKYAGRLDYETILYTPIVDGQNYSSGKKPRYQMTATHATAVCIHKKVD